MKILIEFLWETEAPPVFSYGLAAGLKANGHDVYCILLDRTENREQWLETFGPSHLYFIPCTIIRNKPISSAIKFLGSCFGIKQKFGKITFDLTIRTFIHPINSFLFRFIHSNRTADICHDPIPHAGMSPKAAEIYRQQIRNADDVIVLTKAFIPILEEQYGKIKNKYDILYRELRIVKTEKMSIFIAIVLLSNRYIISFLDNILIIDLKIR